MNSEAALRIVEEKRARDLERATETLRRQQAERTHGAITFFMRDGRIVRYEVRTSETFDD